MYSNEIITNYFNDHLTMLKSTAISIFRNKEIANDIVSNFFITLMENEKMQISISNARNIKAYLYVSIRNFCYDYIDKEKKETTKSYSAYKELLRINEGPFLENTNKTKILINKINELPKQRSGILKLKYIAGKNNYEIAEILNLSINTIKTHSRLGLKNLRGEKIKSYKKIKEPKIKLPKIIKAVEPITIEKLVNSYNLSPLIIKHLPNNSRIWFDLFYNKRQSIDEICLNMKWSLKLYKYYVDRALKILKYSNIILLILESIPSGEWKRAGDITKFVLNKIGKEKYSLAPIFKIMIFNKMIKRGSSGWYYKTS